MDYNINFPNLGIYMDYVIKSFDVFGFTIAMYGITMALGILGGLLVALSEVKRTKQNEEYYLDIAFFGVIFSVICARIYYVIFSWDRYKDNPLSVFNIREGGIAMYGAVIGAVATAYIYCRIKKLSWPLVFDTAVLGLITGQIIGRWGNFFNREVFGEYTNGPLAMQLPLSAVRAEDVSPLQMENLVELNGVTYIQAHPTFLYESLWNLMILIIMLTVVRHKKKFDGEVFLFYLAGYGLGRFFIEWIRTDQLKTWGLNIPVSMIVAAVTFVVAVVLILILRKRIPQKKAAVLTDATDEIEDEIRSEIENDTDTGINTVINAEVSVENNTETDFIENQKEADL